MVEKTRKNVITGEKSNTCARRLPGHGFSEGGCAAAFILGANSARLSVLRDSAVNFCAQAPVNCKSQFISFKLCLRPDLIIQAAS
jgi:hypothetical protein